MILQKVNQSAERVQAKQGTSNTNIRNMNNNNNTLYQD